MNTPDVLAVVIPLVIAAGVYVWTSITLARVFLRLGIPSWKAWVPVLNIAEIFIKAGTPAWYVVLLFVPVANLYGIYQLATAFHRINLAFGKGAGMTALAVLLLPVWATIIGSEGAATPTLPPEEAPMSDPTPSTVPVEPMAPPAAAPADPAPVEPAPAEQPPAASAPAQLPTEPPASTAPAPLTIAGASTFAPPPAAAAPPATPPIAPVIAPPPGAALVEPAVVEETATPVDRNQVILEEPVVAQVAAEQPPALDEPPVPEEVATLESEPDEEEDHTVVVDDEPDEEEDHTVVVDRRPAIVWELVTEGGERLPLTSASVVLGRKPGPVKGSTVIAVPDVTKTLSKVHARLDLDDDTWTITDLGSTNGVLVIEPDGTEREIEASGSSVVTGSFVLGKVVLEIERVGSSG